jgi:formylglycine-generating enzyme required for sulfatase activity
MCVMALAVLGLAANASLAGTLVPIVTVNDYVAGTNQHLPAGGPGNAKDPLTGSKYGSVNYSYGIGTTETTNQQYCNFLNSVAKLGDPYALYNTSMNSTPTGGITRTGSGTAANPYVYTPKAGFASKPVVFVSWYDAVRYSNWLTNQANGTGNGTEMGGYAIAAGGFDKGLVTVPTLAQRQSWSGPVGPPYNQYWLLPTENEWYKAAYYQGANTGNLAAGYKKYPTKSNTAPTAQAPPGGANSADYMNVPGLGLVPVQSYPNSLSAYGTADQGGNVSEWMENLYSTSPTVRVVRGGSAFSVAAILASTARMTGSASMNYRDVGFRVIMVPEPSSLVMLLGGAVLALICCYRRRQG